MVYQELTSHTLIHTFAVLNYPPHFVPDSLGGKCELRDVIHGLLLALHAAHPTFSLVALFGLKSHRQLLPIL